VNRVEREPTGCGLDPVELADLRDVALGERQLRRRHEVVARELRARLAQVSKPEPRAAVLLLQLLALVIRESREEAWAAATVVARGEVDGPRHRHVGADAGERLQDRRLRVVEPAREGVHGHDERDPDAEAQCGQDRTPEPAAKFGERVGDVEHGETQQTSVR
jgi:hypothetical protein